MVPRCLQIPSLESNEPCLTKGNQSYSQRVTVLTEIITDFAGTFG